MMAQVVQRRHDEDGPRARLARGTVECLRHKAFFVDVDRRGAPPDGRRLVHHRGIGQRFGQDRVAGLGRAEYRRQDRLLRPRTDHQFLGIGRECAMRDPFRRHRPLMQRTADGRVAVERRAARHVRQRVEEAPHRRAENFRLSDRRGQRRLHRRLHRVGQRVECRRADVRAASRIAVAHIGAASDFARHLAAACRQRIGARHGAHRHAQPIGEVA